MYKYITSIFSTKPLNTQSDTQATRSDTQATQSNKLTILQNKIADGACSVSDLNDFLQPEPVKRVASGDRRYDILKCCIKKRNLPLINKLLCSYDDILNITAADMNIEKASDDINYTPDLLHIELLKYIVDVDEQTDKPGYIFALLLKTKDYSNILTIPHMHHNYIDVLSVYTVEKNKVYKLLLDVARNGQIKKLCFCNGIVHNYECIYNEIYCVPCYIQSIKGLADYTKCASSVNFAQICKECKHNPPMQQVYATAESYETQAIKILAY